MWAVSMTFWRWILVAQLGVVPALLAADRPEPAKPDYICIDIKAPEHRTITASLMTRDRYPDCGNMLVETPMQFADIAADNATIRVMVPCAEMPRSMYSRYAGDAPVLEVGRTYRLELIRVADEWRADRIDLVH